METPEVLKTIEVALNIPSGGDDPEGERLGKIIFAIKTLSHRAGYVNLQYTQIMNGLVDFLDFISVDFSEFDNPTEAEQEWDKWRERFYQRPRYNSYLANTETK